MWHFVAFEERYFGYLGVIFIILEVLRVSWRFEDILVILKYCGRIFGYLGDIFRDFGI